MVLPYNIGDAMTYTCYNCKKTKDLSLFYKQASKKNGHSSRCKKCDNILKADWRSRNIVKVRAYEYKRWRDSSKRKADLARSQKYRLEISDSYVRELVTKKSKTLKPQDLSDEFIEIYRINLKLKRALKLTPKLKGEEDSP